MQKATRQQTKDHNTRLILKTVYDAGEISRADIARATHLTRPTVSSIVADLIESNFVVETGQGPSAGGKRPTL
ncbi:MAG: MarR family transcriptional regulator, partial [Anaerolineae bacterium]|nr:MarR family transcriptional regulator [Anaerolineae bacterium]